MRLTETAGLLASSINAAFVITRSPVVAATVAVALSLLMITDAHYASLHDEDRTCVGLGGKKERS